VPVLRAFFVPKMRRHSAEKSGYASACGGPTRNGRPIILYRFVTLFTVGLILALRDDDNDGTMLSHEKARLPQIRLRRAS
jgi:hypothetical protein